MKCHDANRSTCLHFQNVALKIYFSCQSFQVVLANMRAIEVKSNVVTESEYPSK